MELKNKRVCVTGSSGVIGRYLVQRLRERGADVLGLDKVAPALPHVDFIQCDLSKLVPQGYWYFDPEVVFHLAAVFGRTIDTPGFWRESFDNDVLASHNLIKETAQACPNVTSFVFASSYLVYASWLYHLDAPIPLRESDPIRPRNIVGAAKYFTEQELRFVRGDGARFTPVSARIFRVYGGGGREIISRWARDAKAGVPLKMYNGESSFDFIHADDVAEGLIRLAEHEAEGAVNLGTGTSTPIREIARLISEKTGCAVEDKGNDDPVERSMANPTFLKETTRWLPPTGITLGIQKAIAEA